MTTEDEWYARRLPDDFVARSGDALLRLSKIVKENWWGYNGVDLARLMELLLPVLQPLTGADGEVSDDVRDRCVGLVGEWLAERRPYVLE
jgi:hypothetical protein